MINQVGVKFAEELVSYYAARLAFERICINNFHDRYVQGDLEPHMTLEEKLCKECSIAEKLLEDVKKYGVLGEILETYYNACKELHDYQDDDDPNIQRTITNLHDAEDDLARYGYPLTYGFETYCHMLRK